MSTCKTCGSEFHGKQGKRYCSAKCRPSFYEPVPPELRKPRAYTGPKVKAAWKSTKLTCQHCSKEFIPKAADRRTYCSRECAYDASSASRLARLDDQCREYERLVSLPCLRCGSALRVEPRYCAQCAVAGRNEERLWRVAKTRLEGMKKRTCRQCGVSTADQPQKAKLCARCSYDSEAEQRKRAKWARKARLRNAPSIPTDHLAIFKRDKWRCQICGCRTNRKSATVDDRYPTLDHIIPISKGGAHAPWNLRCACRACNLAKSDRLEPAQLGIDALCMASERKGA